MKTYYYLYQITNLINNKIYVGVHKTQKINDGYMGSGKIIRSAMEKYGVSNFSKVILEFFDTSEAMYAREKEVVTAEFLLREDTYNLRRGGHGGFDYINSDVNNRIKKNKKARESTNKVLEEKYGKDYQSIISKIGNTIRHEKYPTLSSTVAKKGHEEGWFSFKNMKHTDKTKKIIGQKNSVNQSGEKNSQYGTMWVTNGIANKKIKKTDSIPDGWRKGRINSVVECLVANENVIGSNPISCSKT